MPKESAIRGLGPLESKIMRLLWADGEHSVRWVAGRLEKGNRPAYTTVMTVMSRLAEKGLLSRRAEGRAFLYRPTMTKQEYEAFAAQKRVRALVRDFGDVALVHFVQEIERADPKRLEQLSRFLRETEKR